MKTRGSYITLRVPEEMKEKIEEVAKRYDMTTSKAGCFLLECGLDVERDYRPILYVTRKTVKFAEKLKEQSGLNEEKIVE